MKKKILSMLLVACMIVGLLPMVALAADPVATTTTILVKGAQVGSTVSNSLELVFTATAQYAKTNDAGEISAATVTDEATDEWSIKYQMVDGVAVMTMKGAKIGDYTGGDDYTLFASAIVATANPAPVKIVVEEDSFIYAVGTAGIAFIGGNMTSLTIESKGDAKLTMTTAGSQACINVNAVDLTLNNANIDIIKTHANSSMNGSFIACNNLTVTGGNINLTGCMFGGHTIGVAATQSATFENTNFTLDLGDKSSGKGLQTGALTIKGNSNVTFTADFTAYNMATATTAVVEDGSVLTIDGAQGSLIVNDLTVTDATLNLSSFWQSALNVAGTFTLEGSSATLSATNIEDSAIPAVQFTAADKFIIKDSSLVVKGTADMKLLAAIPTMDYTDDYCMMLGTELDGSDAAEVTDLTPATEAVTDGPAYLKIAAMAANSWTTEPSIEGWTAGETAKTPVGAAAYGDVVFTYSDAEDGTYTATVPTNAGTYWMKAEVAGTDAYTGLSAKVSFTIAQAATNTPDPSNPQTGDNTAVLTAITLFALTAMAAAVVVTKKVIVR